MTRVSQLFDLQEIDSGMERRVVRLRQIDEQMLDSPTLVAARQVHEEARGVLAAHQAELKKLSEETEDVSRRIKTQDARLYNGSVKNPKELGQIHEEVTHLKT